jgi:threonine/homoserine/homoserine lactone efflux protein
VVGLPLLSFLALTVPLVLTPGASTAVVLRNAVAGGTRAGVITAVGINSGSLCYGLLTAFGFAVALRRWPTAWSVVHAAGVAYLAWLGLQSIVRAVRPAAPHAAIARAAAPDSRRALYEGLMTNLLNPAIATFYLVLLPQFIPDGLPVVRSALILTAIHITLAASWHVVWAAAGGRLSLVLASGRPRRILEAVAGTALLALAVKMAVA